MLLWASFPVYSSFSRSVEVGHEAGQRAQWVEHLPYQREDLSSIPSTHTKKKMGRVVCACTPSAGEVEKGSSLGLAGPPD